jgi:signal transduction histidine kinase
LRADESCRDIVVLMVTAFAEREQRIVALAAGVDDFLAKPVDRVELRARVTSALRIGRFRRQLEERQRVESLITLSPIAVLVVGAADGIVRFANERAATYFATPTMIGVDLAAALDARDAEQLREWRALAPTLAKTEAKTARWSLGHATSAYDVSAGAVRWQGDDALQVVLTDVTAITAVERRLRQQERLESIGRLAASVAHDFNTVLQVASLQLHVLGQQTVPGRARVAIEEIDRALKRGGLLTKDLLAFCRQPPERGLNFCDAALVVRGIQRTLGHLMPRTIVVSVVAPNTPVRIGVAAHEIEQMLVNLATNARDAMPEGGALLVRLAPSAERAGWWQLIVTDSGSGMDDMTQSRLREPFFTTKPEGQGTGLGLWMVNRITLAAGGTCEISSRLGMGTTVTLDFPPADVSPESA